MSRQTLPAVDGLTAALAVLTSPAGLVTEALARTVGVPLGMHGQPLLDEYIRVLEEMEE